MSEKVVRQQCFNHPARGAACRCPACSRPFCRECVSEHDSRLLCATCLATSVSSPDRWRARRIAPFVVSLLGLASTLLVWALFFSFGRIIMESVTLVDRYQWRDR
jgi:hypothetical protein